MTPRTRTRRAVLRAVGAGVVGTLATGVTTASTPVEEDLETVRAATEQYRDVRTALADGFVPGGPYVPGMGWHWLNPDRVQTAASNGPNLTEPQLLVYSDTDPTSAEGHLVLGAVEWAIPVGAQGFTEDDQPDLFSEGDGVEEHWHVHHSRRHVFASGDGAVTDPGSLSVAEMLQRGQWAELPPDASVEPGDEVTADWGLTGTESTATIDMAPEPHPDLLTLHAWVHLLNSDHPLAATNANQAYVHMIPNDLMSDRTAKPG